MYFNAIPIDFYVVKSFICIKFGRDKLLMTPHICIDFRAKSVQGRIQSWAIIGQWGAPSPINFFFRPEGYSNKPNAQQLSRNIWEEVMLFLVSFISQVFDAFLTSFLDFDILVYFNAISVDFYAVKSFICINYV